MVRCRACVARRGWSCGGPRPGEGPGAGGGGREGAVAAAGPGDSWPAIAGACFASLRLASPRRVPGRRLGPERRLARPACAGASPDAGPAARAPRPGGQSSGAPRRPGPASGRSARNAVGWGQLSPLRREGGPGASGLAPGASRRCAAEHLPAGRGGCLARGWAGGIPRLRLERAVLLVCLFSVAVSLLPLCFFP